MPNAIEQIAVHKLVPVIKLDSPDQAVPLCEALVAGGLPVAEITFRTDAAEESIRRARKAFPDILLGAGTVTNTEQVKRAVDAGATYIVTPGFSHAVADYCVKNSIALTAGACTPTEIMYIMDYGLEVAKFFPAGQYGGVATIKALAGPFPHMKFLPTGGISDKNVKEYLAFPKVIACGGSWMVPGGHITDGRWSDIKALVSEAVALVK